MASGDAAESAVASAVAAASSVSSSSAGLYTAAAPAGGLVAPGTTRRKPRAEPLLPYEPEPIVVRVEGEEVEVDLKACAEQVVAFQLLRQAQRAGRAPSSQAVDLDFEVFPGGAATMKSITRYLEVLEAEERAVAASAGHLGVPLGVLKVDPAAFQLRFTVENIGRYLEAAALLRCPRILREAVLSPAAKELPSRKVLALLEVLVRYTVDDAWMGSPALAHLVAESKIPSESQPLDAEAVLPPAQVAQAFGQAIQRLCARLDAVDFKLQASLAAGSPSASLEVLRAFKVKMDNLGRVNYALQSVTSIVKNTTANLFFYEEDKSDSRDTQTKQLDWTEHHFALHTFRKHIIESMLNSTESSLRMVAERALYAGQESPSTDPDADYISSPSAGESDDDIPDALCDYVTSDCLLSLAALVQYCVPAQTPPVLAATMVRALLLADEADQAASPAAAQAAAAQKLFEAIFTRSRKVQSMVVDGKVPVDFLVSVKSHKSASSVLRKLLGQHEQNGRSELCHVLGHVLLEEFRDEPHCHELIFTHPIARDLTVYCRASTRAVATSEEGTLDDIAVVPGTSGDAEMLRLRKVGERLFAHIFVTHSGFLPAAEAEDEPSARQGLNWTAVECPWDSGDLDLPLLQHVPDDENALHLLRRVLLRGLLRRQQIGVESDVPTTARLWAYGRWPGCHDAGLISEAFAFLSSCWRALRCQRARGAAGTAASAATEAAASAAADLSGDMASRDGHEEESLFAMFKELQFWRIETKHLLTPWVPPHLLACHLAARCKKLDVQQRSLNEENKQSLQEINRLRLTIRQLDSKLVAVEARSVTCAERQAEVSEALRNASRTMR